MKETQRVGRLQAPRMIQLDWADVPVPGPCDVLIQVAVSGICGTDLGFFREGAATAGAILGHEFSGTVVAAGNAVRGIGAGDRVVANPMIDGIGLGRVAGSFAEYLCLPAAEPGRNIFTLPPGIPDEIGALIEPFAVGLHAVNRARAKRGERVVIFGAGPIGLCVLLALRAGGVSEILVIDPSKLRRGIALQMGASAVHDPGMGSSAAFVGSHFGEGKVPYARQPIAQADIAFDCAGVGSVLDDAVHSLTARGRLVIVADPHDLALPGLRLVMLRELEVLGAVAYDSEFAEAIALLESRAVDLQPLITHRFPLERLDEAFAVQMDADHAIKVLVESRGSEG